MLPADHAFAKPPRKSPVGATAPRPTAALYRGRWLEHLQLVGGEIAAFDSSGNPIDFGGGDGGGGDSGGGGDGGGDGGGGGD